MQKIQKKKDRRLSVRLMMISSIVFLLLCAGAILLLNSRKEAERPKKAEQDLVLYQKNPELLSSVTLYRNGEYQLTLLHRDSTLILEDQPDFPLREAAVESLLSLAQSLTADELIAELPAQSALSLAPYGLDPAERTAVFQYNDGSSVTLRVGSLIPIENPRYYALIDGQNALYSVTQDIRDAVSRTAENLHPVVRPQIKSGLLDRITVTGDMDFDAVLTPQGWQMLRPVSYPLSGAAMESLLTQLENIRFAGWIGKADDLSLSGLGLAPARRVLTVTFAETIVTAPDGDGRNVSFPIPSNQLSFSLGNVRNDTSFYLMYEDQVYSGSVLSFSFLQSFSWDKYLLAAPVSLPVQSLSAVVWEENGKKTVFDISCTERVLKNNEFETDENGQILYDLNASADGQPVDADSFVSWYLALSGLRGTQRTEEKKWTAETEPLLTLTLTGEDRRFERKITVCPYSAVQDLLFVDGVSLYLIDSSWRASLPELPFSSVVLHQSEPAEQDSAVP